MASYEALSDRLSYRNRSTERLTTVATFLEIYQKIFQERGGPHLSIPDHLFVGVRTTVKCLKLFPVSLHLMPSA
jgi:hypothetical protein